MAHIISCGCTNHVCDNKFEVPDYVDDGTALCLDCIQAGHEISVSQSRPIRELPENFEGFLPKRGSIPKAVAISNKDKDKSPFFVQ